MIADIIRKRGRVVSIIIRAPNGVSVFEAHGDDEVSDLIRRARDYACADPHDDKLPANDDLIAAALAD
jgi:hypothetical protein